MYILYIIIYFFIYNLYIIVYLGFRPLVHAGKLILVIYMLVMLVIC